MKIAVPLRLCQSRSLNTCLGLHAAGSRHVVYVPDNPLSHVLGVLRDRYPDVQTTIATRERKRSASRRGSTSAASGRP